LSSARAEGGRLKVGRLKGGRLLRAIAAVVVATLVAAAMVGCHPRPAEPPGGSAALEPAPAHADRFVTRAQLDAALALGAEVAGDARRAGLGPTVDVVVVPHHLVAGHLVAGALAYLAVEPPATVIIVGPDHFRAGPRVGTSLGVWRTAGGVVEPESDLVAALLLGGMAEEAWRAQEGEHSVGALVPFVRSLLPGARVVPITVRGDLSYEEAVALGKWLREWADGRGKGDAGVRLGRVVLVASVDFSHYLDRREAEKRDVRTIAALESGDWAALFGMGSEYLDSPASLAAAFAFAGSVEKPRFAVVAHTNSATLLGRLDLAETTSHYLLLIPSP
jgi:AmmeMemoRadiSam system protein B